MDIKPLQSLIFGGLIASSVAISSTAYAAYPDRPVTMVVAFAPGGMTDTVTRLLARELEKRFNQSFVVQNKPGATGQVGTEYVMRQQNDGYTLLIGSTGYVIGPAVNTKVKYDPIKDFEPIAVLAKAPNVMVANPKLGVKTIPEFLSWAKQRQGVPYSSAGFGGSTHLGGEWLKKIAGIPLEHVPYKGAAPGTLAAVSGEVPVSIQDSMSVASFIDSGQMQAIGMMGAQRSKFFPDLPTFAESGIEGLDVYTWLGLYAPAGTDPQIVAILNKTVGQIMNSPEMVERLKAQNSEPGEAMSPHDVANFVEAETAKWKSVVRMTGVQVE